MENLTCVCITWSITNLTMGNVTSTVETRNEAIICNCQGQTIAHKVFREALENRARDLEQWLSEASCSERNFKIEARIRALRPRRFSEGVLVFGLQHKVVQDECDA